MLRCKFCTFGLAALALTSLAAVGVWAWKSRTTPQPEVVKAGPAAPTSEIEILPEPQPYVADADALKGPGHVSAGAMLQIELNRLHHAAVNRFLATNGFGKGRMIAFPTKVIKEWKIPWWSPGELDKETPLDSNPDLALIHTHSLKDFATLKPLVGPEPKGSPNALAIPRVTGPPDASNPQKAWEMKSLDLVGLVKHKDPVVYISEKLPDMKKLDGVPTRPLDLFEFAGIEALQGGSNLFARGKDDTIRMLGAIRATSECLTCHSANKDGDLLGAFSYIMRGAEYRRDDWGRGGSSTVLPGKEVP